MISQASIFLAVQVVAVGSLLPLLPGHPLSVWETSFNTAGISPRLQARRAAGSYYLHPATGSEGPNAVHAIFNVDYRATARTRHNGTLLLLHGFPSSSADFEEDGFLAGLLQLFPRVIAYDYLGFGLSDKPRLAESPYSAVAYANIAEGLLAHLGVEDVHVLAHDLGDTVAQELLARHNDRAAAAELTGGFALPPRVRSVALLNGGLFPEQHRALLMQQLLASPYTGPFLASILQRGPFERVLAGVFGPGTQPTQAFLDDTWAALCFNNGRLVLHQLQRYIQERRKHRSRWVAALTDTEVPLLLVNGPHDPISGRHAADRYMELIPKPRVVLLPDNIGHYPQVEAPSLVLDAIRAFHKDFDRKMP